MHVRFSRDLTMQSDMRGYVGNNRKYQVSRLDQQHEPTIYDRGVKYKRALLLLIALFVLNLKAKRIHLPERKTRQRSKGEGGKKGGKYNERLKLAYRWQQLSLIIRQGNVFL